jgi:hypothetical protein
MKHLLACVGCLADSSFIIADELYKCKENFAKEQKKFFHRATPGCVEKNLPKAPKVGNI